MNVPPSKRILLMEPPYYRLYKDTFCLVKYPLALGYLSGVILRDTDWVVQACNTDFNPEQNETASLAHMTGKGYERYLANLRDVSMPIWDEVAAVLRDFRPDVLGISCKTQNFASTRIVAAIAKRLNKDVTVVLGGPHASMAGEEPFACEDVDITVLGEGERTIVELLRALERGDDLMGVNGIIFRGPDGKPVHTLPRPYIDDLDSLPFPHESAERALRDYERYPPGAFQFIFATRGCPYACQFCGSRNIWTRKVRYRSAENVGEEIRRLQARGVNSIHYDDDTFGLSKKYIRALCETMMEKAPGIAWSCETTVNIIDAETVDWMKRSGCRSIQIGVESGNNEMLRLIRKNITIEKAYEAADLIKRRGIQCQTFFMAGFPEETEATLEDTRAAIRRISSDEILFSIYTPYPGTENFDICRDNGLIDESYDVALYNHQSPENCFTANIPRDRFRELVIEMAAEVDQINRNRKAMRRRAELWASGKKALREQGLVYTLGKTLRVINRTLNSR